MASFWNKIHFVLLGGPATAGYLTAGPSSTVMPQRPPPVDENWKDCYDSSKITGCKSAESSGGSPELIDALSSLEDFTMKCKYEKQLSERRHWSRLCDQTSNPNYQDDDDLTVDSITAQLLHIDPYNATKASKQRVYLLYVPKSK